MVLQEFKQQGKAKNIGVANYEEKHLQPLLDDPRYVCISMFLFTHAQYGA